MNFNRIFAIVSTLAFWAVPVAASPRISVESPTYDFGSIQQGKTIEHLFRITNSGDAPLTIKSVRPSCGCTAAATTKSVILPGKSSEIKASFNSARIVGPVHKTIEVLTNDPKTEKTTLALKGTIIEAIQVNPKQLNLGQIKINATFRTTVVVTNMGKLPFKIAGVKSTIPQITATVDRKHLKTGESTRIAVAVSPRAGDRMLSAYLTIATDNPENPEIVVPVYGTPIP